MQEGIDLGRRQLGKPAVPAAGVIDDEDVERADCFGCGCDDALRRRRVGEVRFAERHREFARDRLGTPRLGAAGLRCVVRRPALNEDRDSCV